jgi:hypothetical protein
MAPVSPAGAEWVHVRPLRRPHAPGGPASDPPTAASPGGSSPLPMIGRHLPASSSFVLAAARLRALQLDTAHATAQTGSHGEKPQGTAPPSPATANRGNRARPARPLDKQGPHGCSNVIQQRLCCSAHQVVVLDVGSSNPALFPKEGSHGPGCALSPAHMVQNSTGWAPGMQAADVPSTAASLSQAGLC